MAMAGGAMLGYCAIGSVLMANPPPSMMTIASTQAKIGRSMKNSDTRGALGFLRGRAGRLAELFGSRLVRMHDRAGTHALNPDDDDLLARRDAVGDQPLIADGSVGLDHADGGFVVRAR